MPPSAATTTEATLPSGAQQSTAMAKLAAYFELTKPKIVALELVAVLIALHLATGYGAPGSPWSLSLVLAVSLGTGFVAASANALNQWIEREYDARMPRTKDRPLPSGRLTPDEALWFGAGTLALGASMLATLTGPAATLVALGTWFVYVALYTPMKRRSWLNTAVGAVSGATPLAIGWAAGGGRLDDPLILAMLATMYVWQFPHFMAIAWLLRDDYRLVNYQMSTSLDPSGEWAGFQAVVGSALLLPISLAPAVWMSGASALGYLVCGALAALAMLAASAAFLAERNDRNARRLMRVSLLYVPAWLLALWCCVG